MLDVDEDKVVVALLGKLTMVMVSHEEIAIATSVIETTIMSIDVGISMCLLDMLIKFAIDDSSTMQTSTLAIDPTRSLHDKSDLLMQLAVPVLQLMVLLPLKVARPS